MRKQLLAGVALVCVAIGGTIGVAMADKDLSDHPIDHRHYINGQEVGPRICDHPDDAGVQEAFNQFHANHHSHGGTGGQGPIAPGINDEQGPRLTFSAC